MAAPPAYPDPAIQQQFAQPPGYAYPAQPQVAPAYPMGGQQQVYAMPPQYPPQMGFPGQQLGYPAPVCMHELKHTDCAPMGCLIGYFCCTRERCEKCGAVMRQGDCYSQ